MTEIYIGKPCKKANHNGLRYISNKLCVECAKDYSRWQRQYRREDRKVWNRTSAQKKAGLPEPTRFKPENCECCGRHQDTARSIFSIDHCHTIGLFRGWLCNKCNTALGMLGDNLQGVQNAIKYLEAFEHAA